VLGREHPFSGLDRRQNGHNADALHQGTNFCGSAQIHTFVRERAEAGRVLAHRPAELEASFILER